jgi:hypothetical protein
MIQSSQVRSTVAAGGALTDESLSSFASRLHDHESALVRAVHEDKDLEAEFGSFVRSYLADEPPREVREAVLISHSLLRIFQSPELRTAAIDCTPYLDVWSYFDAPNAIIQALGRFAGQDHSVVEFLSSISEGPAQANLYSNHKAKSLARQILSCSKIESDREDIPSKEESCRLVGVQL